MISKEANQKVNSLICEISTQLQERVKGGIIDSEEIESLARLVEIITPAHATDLDTPVVGFHIGNHPVEDETP